MTIEVWITLSKALGGIGIFMMGMIVMTNGLRSLTANAITRVLIRYTKTPTSGAITGAISTAILQSSSATTVAAVGFVGAGMLAFPEALGIIFGANIGTTITGWMVALLGFKFKLGSVMMPLILVGAILKLFSKDKLAAFGYALAGFGLIFVGIEWMQEGMSAYEEVITFENLPSESILGSIKLLLIGVIATIITQSSSAGVATTLTLLYANAINFEQAATLIIGMDLGTTFTAALAAMGGSTAVKRTGFSHVIYNTFTAIGALLLITPYTLALNYISPGALTEYAEIALVGFHTFFNTIGVIAVLPFTDNFANMMKKIVKSPKQIYKQKFDTQLLENLPLAMSVVQKDLKDNFEILLHHINFSLGNIQNSKKANLFELKKSLNELERFIDKIHFQDKQSINWQRFIDIIHINDHLQRLYDRCEEDENKIVFLKNYDHLEEEKKLFLEGIEEILLYLNSDAYTKDSHRGQQSAKTIDQTRNDLTSLIADNSISIEEGTKALESARWIKRSSEHIDRIVHHLKEANLGAGK